MERTHCLVPRHHDFISILDESVDLANGLLRVLASRLYDADRKLARYAPDPLTGLNSRRALHEQYRRVAAGARRRKSGLLLMALDVRNLKAVNDAFGYVLGDEVLRTVADALTEATRTTDVVSRYGGDEFAVLLVETSKGGARLYADRIRQVVATFAYSHGKRVTASFGVASLPDDEASTSEELFRAADEALYAAKRAGKNQVVAAGPGQKVD